MPVEGTVAESTHSSITDYGSQGGDTFIPGKFMQWLLKFVKGENYKKSPLCLADKESGIVSGLTIEFMTGNATGFQSVITNVVTDTVHFQPLPIIPGVNSRYKIYLVGDLVPNPKRTDIFGDTADNSYIPSVAKGAMQESRVPVSSVKQVTNEETGVSQYIEISQETGNEHITIGNTQGVTFKLGAATDSSTVELESPFLLKIKAGDEVSVESANLIVIGVPNSAAKGIIEIHAPMVSISSPNLILNGRRVRSKGEGGAGDI